MLAFVEITQADPDLAAVFLKHNDWEIEPAVEEYMNNPGRYMVETDDADADETVRQPLAPIVSRLADDEYEPSVRSRRGKRKRVEQSAQPRVAESIFDALRDLKSEEDYFKHLKNVDSTLLVTAKYILMPMLTRPPCRARTDQAPTKARRFVSSPARDNHARQFRGSECDCAHWQQVAARQCAPRQ